MSVWVKEIGKPFKLERIGDRFWLLWLENVITEASLMTRSIKLHSMLYELDVFSIAGLGGFDPQPKPGVLGGSAPRTKKKKKSVFKNRMFLSYYKENIIDSLDRLTDWLTDLLTDCLTYCIQRHISKYIHIGACAYMYILARRSAPCRYVSLYGVS